MQNQNKHFINNFWFGFLLGAGATGAAAFFFGTKNGRKTLQKLLDLSENIEENLIYLAEEFGEEIKEKGIEITQEITKTVPKKEESTLNQLLRKMSSLSPQSQSKIKKFFIKE
ncbi:MAG: hypothetical protein Q7R95_02645 [bacterium]|nr:hypothetical protein [bacterium]